jgi:hypothetical protein
VPPRMPVVAGVTFDPHAMFQQVQRHGGLRQVVNDKNMQQIVRAVGLLRENMKAGSYFRTVVQRMKKTYVELLLPLEIALRETGYQPVAHTRLPASALSSGAAAGNGGQGAGGNAGGGLGGGLEGTGRSSSSVASVISAAAAIKPAKPANNHTNAAGAGAEGRHAGSGGGDACGGDSRDTLHALAAVNPSVPMSSEGRWGGGGSHAAGEGGGAGDGVGSTVAREQNPKMERDEWVQTWTRFMAGRDEDTNWPFIAGRLGT